MFPSPSRGSYFSIGQKILEYDMTHNVSVPFPGILFLNVAKGFNQNVSLIQIVSVPFPGILFLNNVECENIRSMVQLFPSPSRGSYFSIMYNFLIFLKNLFEVSVPFPGILFLNPKKQGLWSPWAGCFRPLPGDLISQSCPLHA